MLRPRHPCLAPGAGTHLRCIAARALSLCIFEDSAHGTEVPTTFSGLPLSSVQTATGAGSARAQPCPGHSRFRPLLESSCSCWPGLTIVPLVREFPAVASVPPCGRGSAGTSLDGYHRPGSPWSRPLTAFAQRAHRWCCRRLAHVACCKPWQTASLVRAQLTSFFGMDSFISDRTSAVIRAQKFSLDLPDVMN